jgi:RNA polymerase sigma factor (sigma-70 family)
MTMLSSPEVEADLLARARNGDEAAWSELFHTCYPKVLRAIRRRLNRPMRNLYDSSDFANDVMKSLAANIGRLEFASLPALVAFLAKTAEDKVIDEYRRRHTLKRDCTREVRISGVYPDGTSIDVASGDATASQQCIAREMQEQLFGISNEQLRTIVELRDQGEDNDAIARHLGCSVRTVQRALKKLEDSIRGGKPGD